MSRLRFFTWFSALIILGIASRWIVVPSSETSWYNNNSTALATQTAMIPLKRSRRNYGSRRHQNSELHQRTESHDVVNDDDRPPSPSNSYGYATEDQARSDVNAQLSPGRLLKKIHQEGLVNGLNVASPFHDSSMPVDEMATQSQARRDALPQRSPSRSHAAPATAGFQLPSLLGSSRSVTAVTAHHRSKTISLPNQGRQKLSQQAVATASCRRNNFYVSLTKMAARKHGAPNAIASSSLLQEAFSGSMEVSDTDNSQPFNAKQLAGLVAKYQAKGATTWLIENNFPLAKYVVEQKRAGNLRDIKMLLLTSRTPNNAAGRQEGVISTVIRGKGIRGKQRLTLTAEDIKEFGGLVVHSMDVAELWPEVASCMYFMPYWNKGNVLSRAALAKMWARPVPESRYVLLGGSSGRDFDLGLGALAQLRIPVKLVTSVKGLSKQCLKRNRCELYQQVSNQQFLQLLQGAWVIFIPLVKSPQKQLVGLTTVVEAHSYGKVVVASEYRTGMWDGVLSNGDGALIVPAGDMAHAVNAFRRLWENRELHHGLLKGARRLAMDRYSEEALVDLFVGMLSNFSHSRTMDAAG